MIHDTILKKGWYINKIENVIEKNVSMGNKNWNTKWKAQLPRRDIKRVRT